MNRGTAMAILHLLDVAILKGIDTREGRDALRAAINWLRDENNKLGRG